ncbi:hypothetical protein EWM64_g8967 [Hericium alpestre]|uniref:Aldehyde dehydrogenase domain-containing protein n=1 Tax=Hericium alpestre TaxID=135208 RepID=A0A4Y9ZKC9_9AGAM|nr:hypothetical protein EWM64_g8967 [Hericium alpestre]
MSVITATGKTITQVAEATADDVNRAVVSARKALDTVWGLKCPGAERGRLLSRLADLIETHQNELAAIEALNSGTPFMSAKFLDMSVAVASLRYNAGWASKVQGKVIETTENKLVYTRREPMGVCGQISPWNFPLMMVLMKVGPALAAGNTVVIKPSEVNPLTTLRFCSLVKEAGIPNGVINVVVGYGHTVGCAITEHMDIDKVAFTGSTAAGKKIMESAARSNLKKITLELGGKNPAIIFDDADLDKAVKWASHGSFFNAGQVCVATSRLFVHTSIYDEFLARFTAVARAIKLGDPFDLATTQGPQASQAHFARIMAHIESGIAEGATLHLGGHRHSAHGLWIEPTIFTDVRPDMRVAREESFWPRCRTDAV